MALAGDSIRVRTEKMLWWLATGCAILLLFAPLTPRTTWLPTGRNTGGLSQITEGVGWLAIAALLGGVALVGLGLGRRAHRRVSGASTAAGAATIAFLVTAVGLGRHWIDLMSGVSSVRMHPGEPWVLHPAPLVPGFAIVAAAGAGLALALTIRWRTSATGYTVDSATE